MKKLKIAFFTESPLNGRYPRNFPNARTEIAWQIALKATHHPIASIKTLPPNTYDLGIIIIPKKNPNLNIVDFKRVCAKVGVMQEGPNWFYQDYSIEDQINYYNTLVESDMIFAHNAVDMVYYDGLVNSPSVARTSHKPIHIMKSLMIEDAIPTCERDRSKRKGAIIGGNFTSWYGGMDSYIVASEVSEVVHAPSMGRRQPNEEHLVTHLPYLQWNEWIAKLSEFKYAVHLMRTHAAGTFAMNCAYLGIPCIGYEGLDTQEGLFPRLTIKSGELYFAKELIRELSENKDFYNDVCDEAQDQYKWNWAENVWVERFYRDVLRKL